MKTAPIQGFLIISCRLKNAVGFEASFAPRPARPSRQHPMLQIGSLVKAKPGPLQHSDNGEWCCLMASRGSRRQARKLQHLYWTKFSRRDLCSPGIRIRVAGTQAPQKPNPSTLAFWPSARQQAAPLAAGHL